jgi:hypothetical protein
MAQRRRKNANRALVGKSEEKRSLGRPTRRGRIIFKKKTLKLMRREIVDWINLAEDWDKWRAVVNTVMNVAVLENAGNFSNSWGTVNFTRRTLRHGVGLTRSYVAVYKRPPLIPVLTHINSAYNLLL